MYFLNLKKRHGESGLQLADRVMPRVPCGSNIKNVKKLLDADSVRSSINYELNYISKIDEAEKIDQKLFWQLVKKRTKSKTNNICPIKKDNVEYVTDETAIREEWRAHLSQFILPI